jgi:S1-C subfamily serine protease
VDREEWGEEPGDDHPSDPVLPPEQRWWRHPSELAGPAPALHPPPGDRAGSRAPLVLAGTIGVIGALLVGLLVRATVTEPDSTIAIDATSLALPRTSSMRTSAAPATSAVPPTAPPAPESTTAAATPVLLAPSVSAPAAIVSETHVLAAVEDLGGQTVMTLRLPSGDEHEAHVVVTDDMSGVALLEVQVPLTTLAAAGSASALAPGDEVRSADGTAGELIEIVARQPDGEPTSRALLRVRMSNRVAAGTPLFDRQGRAIGFCLHGDDDGSVMVLPIEIARRLAAEAAAGEARGVPWLGIKGRNEPDEGGARIVKVLDGGPAAGAGLRTDDVVVAIDGMAVRSMGSLVLLLEGQAAGKTITLTVERAEADDDTSVDVPVELGARPDPGATVPAATTTTLPPPTTSASTAPTTSPPTTSIAPEPVDRSRRVGTTVP